jgi:hypothetical protein
MPLTVRVSRSRAGYTGVAVDPTCSVSHWHHPDSAHLPKLPCSGISTVFHNYTTSDGQRPPIIGAAC